MTSEGTTGRFSRSDRLLDSRDFRRTLRRGRRRAHSDLVIITLGSRENPNKDRYLGGVDADRSRLGITASRKVGNAVVRNRFKRRIREWFRHRRDDLPDPVDLVVIARPSGAKLSLSALDERLSQLIGIDSMSDLSQGRS